jgi:hypothetical protein
LLQGKIFITNKALRFHSYFNAKTFLGKETKIQVPLKNISKIEKKHNALIFDNSIKVTTKDNKTLFFTSFVHRDNAFDILNKHLKLSCAPDPD